MSSIIEKRTVKIQPCKVDKNLIREIGELLESEKLQLGYNLNSKTKNIISIKINDFIKADWGTGINNIRIETEILRVESVKVEIDFRSPMFSEFSVSGEDATWVNGVTNRVEEIVQKYKLNYAPLKTNRFIQILLAGFIALILSYQIFLVANLFYTENIYNLFLWLTLALTLVMHILIQWLFPYFDYGETLQKRMRKWIIALLISSGLLPTLIFKILGL